MSLTRTFSMRPLPLITFLAGVFLFSSWAQAQLPANWPANYPEWWYHQGVMNTTDLDNPMNHAPVNQGQVFWMADRAIHELNTQLESIGGAGFTVDDFRDPAQTINYFAPVNTGQLKFVASKFFQRFAEIGFTETSLGWPAGIVLDTGAGDNSPTMPWLEDTGPQNFTPVNIGQVKFLFSWDLSSWAGGLPIVDAGPDQIISTLSTTLAGSASDPDSGPNALVTTWSLVSGPGTVTFDDANSLTATVTFSTQGTYVLKLSADDGMSLIPASDEVSIIVDTEDPTIPGGLIVDNALGGPISVSWDASTDNNPGITYEVYRNGVLVSDPDLGDTTFTDSDLKSFTFYTYKIVAKDIAGNVSPDSVEIKVYYQAGSPLAAGDDHSHAVDAAGQLWSWGHAKLGALGISSVTIGGNYAFPVEQPTLSDVIDISSGIAFSVALLGDGSVYSWGDNGQYNLGLGAGYGTGDEQALPQLLTALSSETIVKVATGTLHGMALADNGRLYTWGDNSHGELGHSPSPTDVHTPALVQWDSNDDGSLDSDLENIVSIAAGVNFSVALDVNGDVWTWGEGRKLGRNIISASVTAAGLVTGLSDVTQIAAGRYHSYAVSNGKVWAWGYDANADGQLGNNASSGSSSAPVQVLADADADVGTAPIDLENILSVSSGLNFAVALKGDGTVWSWGDGAKGQLGYSPITHTDHQTVAAQVPGLSNIVWIEAGDDFVMAMDSTGNLWSWGDNSEGQLGQGNVSMLSVPTVVEDFWLNGRAEAPRYTVTNGVYPSGFDTFVSSATVDAVVVYTTNGNEPAYDFATSTASEGFVVTPTTPIPVTATLLHPIRARAFKDGLAPSMISEAYYHIGRPFSAGRDHAHAVDDAGRLWSWGNANYGALGVAADTLSGDYPIAVEATSISDVKDLSSGASFSLALLNGGSVYSWGDNSDFRLGLGDGYTASEDQGLPVFVSSLSAETVVQVEAGLVHGLALTDSRHVYAWGDNYRGQLGRSDVSEWHTPTLVQWDSDANGVLDSNLDNIVSIAAGNYFSVALDSSGDVWSWGSDSRLGRGNIDSTNNETSTYKAAGLIPGLSNISQVSANWDHTYALRADGTVWAWGYDWPNSHRNDGQLGNGTNLHYSFAPAQVQEDDDGDLATDEKRTLSGVVAISAGNNFCIALKSDGTVWSWGRQDEGRLGYTPSNSLYQSIAFQIPGLSDIVWIEAGEDFAMALDRSGNYWTWGHNDHGQLGQGGIDTDTTNQVALVKLPWDQDTDGIEDWWEAFYDLDDPNADLENGGIGDGLTNLEEFIAGSDPTVSDTDGDGLSDVYEVNTIFTKPYLVDTDSDGMGDYIEDFYGLNPLVDDRFEDLDGDRYPNIYEVAASTLTDPSDDTVFPSTNFVVSQDGSTSYSTIASGIQAAVDDASVTYPIVKVKDGVYNEGLTINSTKPLLILSENGPKTTIISRALETTRALLVYRFVVFDGFTISDYNGTALGAAIYCDVRTDVSPHFKRLIIENNTTTNSSVVFMQYTAPLFQRVLFRNNVANSAVLNCGVGSGADLEFCTFVDNSIGAIIGQSDTPITLKNSVLWDSVGDGSTLIESGLNELVLTNSIVKGGYYGGTDLDPVTDAFGFLSVNSVPAFNQVTLAHPEMDIHLERVETTAGIADLGADEWIDNDNGNGTGDGIPDWWEKASFAGDLTAVNSWTGDEDNDASSVLDEYLGETDPTYWNMPASVDFVSQGQLVDGFTESPILVDVVANQDFDLQVSFYEMNFALDANDELVDSLVSNPISQTPIYTTPVFSINAGSTTGLEIWDGKIDGNYHSSSILLYKITAHRTVAAGTLGSNTSDVAVDIPAIYVDRPITNGSFSAVLTGFIGDVDTYTIYQNRQGKLTFTSTHDFASRNILIHNANHTDLTDREPVVSGSFESDNWIPVGKQGAMVGGAYHPTDIDSRILPENSLVFNNQYARALNFSVEGYHANTSYNETGTAMFDLSRPATVTLEIIKPGSSLPEPLYFYDASSDSSDTPVNSLSLSTAGSYRLHFLPVDYSSGDANDWKVFGESTVNAASGTANDGYFRIRISVVDAVSGRASYRYAYLFVNDLLW
ncbi:pectinesterase family protein [Rubellicoccus peritrichatus]|uniref:Pectinesterase family protein n=1 Tax=Rubellicoccus peritrichatus TaxID=3080537 RepID=A0AAQ3LCN1_9BACT|nr:pectinesterase family protein [Puniceicoccus sp. CR14]WOO43031.1 pectinesterase family protein [Puniceicoccus sp. CR14]